MHKINVIGGGFARVEAAWQVARAGAQVRLFEMRPVKETPAHRTDKLAEIVCSNSLKAGEVGSAPYLLKEELRRAGSLVMEVAAETHVPAGAALAVDRHKFAKLFDCWSNFFTGSAGGGVPGGAAPRGCSSRPQRAVAGNPAIYHSIRFRASRSLRAGRPRS